MAALKAIGSIIIGVAAVFAFIALTTIFIYGASWFSMWALPFAGWAVTISIAISVFVLAPFAFFQKTRIVSAAGFLIVSVIFGATTWMFGLLVTLEYWGIPAVIMGLLLGGIGVVPIGMLASAINTAWTEVAILVTGAALTYGARILAFWLERKHDTELERRRRDFLEVIPATRSGS